MNGKAVYLLVSMRSSRGILRLMAGGSELLPITEWGHPAQTSSPQTQPMQDDGKAHCGAESQDITPRSKSLDGFARRRKSSVGERGSGRVESSAMPEKPVFPDSKSAVSSDLSLSSPLPLLPAHAMTGMLSLSLKRAVSIWSPDLSASSTRFTSMITELVTSSTRSASGRLRSRHEASSTTSTASGASFTMKSCATVSSSEQGLSE